MPFPRSASFTEYSCKRCHPGLWRWSPKGSRSGSRVICSSSYGSCPGHERGNWLRSNNLRSRAPYFGDTLWYNVSFQLSGLDAAGQGKLTEHQLRQYAAMKDKRLKRYYSLWLSQCSQKLLECFLGYEIDKKMNFFEVRLSYACLSHRSDQCDVDQSVSPYSRKKKKKKKFVPSLAGVVFLHIDHVQN